MRQKSEKERLWWAQFNALEMGSGWDDTDIAKPQIKMYTEIPIREVSISTSYPLRQDMVSMKKAVSRLTIILPMSVTDALRDMTA